MYLLYLYIHVCIYIYMVWCMDRDREVEINTLGCKFEALHYSASISPNSVKSEISCAWVQMMWSLYTFFIPFDDQKIRNDLWPRRSLARLPWAHCEIEAGQVEIRLQWWWEGRHRMTWARWYRFGRCWFLILVMMVAEGFLIWFPVFLVTVDVQARYASYCTR